MPAIPWFFTKYVVFDRWTDMTWRGRIKALKHSCLDFKKRTVQLRRRLHITYVFNCTVLTWAANMSSWRPPVELATTCRAGDHLSSLRPYMYARGGGSQWPIIIFCGPPSETTPVCRLWRKNVVSIQLDDLVDVEALILLQP